MHVIVTHSNADFDAVASLLGAWIVYPDAIPVLPNTLNRNVRNFITLYGKQLPFVRRKELAKKPINRVTVVDNQQIPSFANIEPDAIIHIIDHHDLHHQPPAGTILSLTDSGANTTFLVEQICQLPSPSLSPIEATLLLLGIYEDTGSFTYGSTTARDLHCVAWLLSEGRASLDIMREYLNYPLSDIQKNLYERLVDNLETYKIHGHTIIIATTSVNHYVEEISPLASLLRDIYHPEALFTIVDMSGRVQIVARSTTDAVDVSSIAEFFGGGGHIRASAALVKDKNLSQIKKELLQLLHLEVKPATIVAQIMSKGAHILAPNDTIRHTSNMMNRYGHEGFPVFDSSSQKISGVISRREVDKALHHKLEGAPIYQFMTKGRFFVVPTDSVDTVQELMTENQIGQVPVVDKPDGKIIGIVTRTDLINMWHGAAKDKSSRLNLASQLEQILSPQLLTMLREAGELAMEKGDTLYIVGGFVRDLLLTMMAEDDGLEAKAKTSPSFDLDLVVEGQAIDLAHHLSKRNGGRVHSHSRFGTAKWILAQPIPFSSEGYNNLTSLDFVTARTEFYRHPSALPEVEQSSIKPDLRRRDFTINSLALRLTPEDFGELLDFYGGQNDLNARLVRALHSLSFVEDPTRMLRAARLTARLNFKLEERTAELLMDALNLLRRVSGKRIAHELELIFDEQQPGKALQQLDKLGIMEAIFYPGFAVDNCLVEQIESLRNGLADTPWDGIKPAYIHYFGLLFFPLASDEQEKLVQRLNMKNDHRDILKQAYSIKHNMKEIAKTKQDSRLYHLLKDTSNDARLISWLALTDKRFRRQLIKFQIKLCNITPIINGNYLKIQMSLPAGPIYKLILNSLRDARLDGLVSNLEDERVLVEQILAKEKNRSVGFRPRRFLKPARSE